MREQSRTMKDYYMGLNTLQLPLLYFIRKIISPFINNENNNMIKKYVVCPSTPVNGNLNVMTETTLSRVHGVDLGYLYLKNAHHCQLLMDYVAVAAVADEMRTLHPN